jgi:acyl-homoserine-lactone acylase
MYLFNGRIPARPNGDFAAWQNTMPGETSASLWTQLLPYDSLPRIVDPASGFVQNSNSPPWFATIPSPLSPEQFPAYVAPSALNMREQRALQMLTGAGRLSFDDLVKMRYSNRSALADRVLDDLITAARASGREPALRAAKVLADWDRTADAGSRGTVLFATWTAAYGLRPSSGRGFSRPWSVDAPITTPSGLSEPERAVAALERAADSVQAKYGALDVPWGDVNRFTAALPGNGQTGDPYGVFHVVSYAPAAGKTYQEAAFGDTYVSAVEFTDAEPRAVAVLSYGNSSRPGSRHVRDQLGLVAAKRMRPVWRSRRDVEANLEKKEVLGRTPN